MKNLIDLVRAPLAILVILLFSVFAVGLLSHQSAIAQPDQALEEICKRYPAGQPDIPEVCQEYYVSLGDEPGDDGVVAFLGEVVSILSIIVGIASVIVVIIGGLFYITSAGDPQKTTKARNTIIYAVIGIAVAVLSQLIIIFVLDRLPADTEEDDQTQTSYVFRV